MVRVPKLPLSMTASANSAPSMGVPVDPVTGYPSLTVWRLRGASFRGAGLRSRPADDCVDHPKATTEDRSSSRHALRVASFVFRASVFSCGASRACARIRQERPPGSRGPLLATSSAKAEPLDQGPVAVDVLL